MRSRRLPGFGFEVQPPPPADVLPRMDVAVFAGFAAAGPLHRPVRVESADQFEMIFGADARLAWDAARGETVYAYLAPAVRAFFRNGGRRAWIIRVAGKAQVDYFPVSGLAQATFDDGGQFSGLRPAYAQARSEGSWADDVGASTALLAQAVTLTVESLDPPAFLATLTSPNDLAVGDLLRLTLDAGYILLCAVRSLEPGQGSPPAPNTFRVACDKAVWLRSSWTQPPPAAAGQAYSFTHAAASPPVTASVPLREGSPVELDWPADDRNPQIKLNLDLAYASAPPLGSLLRADLGGQSFWLRIEAVSAASAAGWGQTAGLQVSGQGVWETSMPTARPASVLRAERLAFELWTRAGGASALRLRELTFDWRHPRDWDALPTDLQLFPESTRPPSAEHADLWMEAADPRFPISGMSQPDTLFVPIGMPMAPDFFLAPDVPVADALRHDGLDQFDERWFLDPDLRDVGVRDLINEADSLGYSATEARSLTGIHAALDLDEATLIVVPDAVQRGWDFRAADRPADPPPSDPPLRPEWWHFVACDPPPVIRPVREPEWGNFLNCDIRLIPAPALLVAAADQRDTFTLRWTQPEAGLAYVLQEATRSDFRDASEIYRGPDDQLTLYGHSAGVFYYRVQAVAGGQVSDWSNGLAVSAAPLSGWALRDARAYSSAPLLAIQHAVLKLCAARGDLLAVLALPEHYRADDAIEHIRLLQTASSGFWGPEEPRTLSFGALYHPWLLGREEDRPNEFRRTPPDGAMAGIIARRTLARGAWIAPANELLTSVVALTPAIERGRWLDLQAAQLNLIRHLPKGFAAMNSDTLASDEDLRPINVRRLLILLRRLALRLGVTYVFEPNDATFQRSVQRGFEALLDMLFLRGAFAGATPATSYQVVTDSSVNTEQSVEQGRFIAELRVAPSLPMTFLTVRLIQTGNRTLVTQEA